MSQKQKTKRLNLETSRWKKLISHCDTSTIQKSGFDAFLNNKIKYTHIYIYLPCQGPEWLTDRANTNETDVGINT